MAINRAVFIDRDGTIAKDVPYCSRPEDFELLPTVGDGIRLLNESGLKVIVVTNQSGIARGYFTEDKLQEIHEKMKRDLADYGAQIDAIYYCPHHPNDHCHCRKPNTGLLERAAQELNLDLSKSYMIGDQPLDMEAAYKAGCQAILISVCKPDRHDSNDNHLLPGIEFVCSDFYAATRWVIAQINGQGMSG